MKTDLLAAKPRIEGSGAFFIPLKNAIAMRQVQPSFRAGESGENAKISQKRP
jgi:hypothetical protein